MFAPPRRRGYGERGHRWRLLEDWTLLQAQSLREERLLRQALNALQYQTDDDESPVRTQFVSLAGHAPQLWLSQRQSASEVLDSVPAAAGAAAPQSTPSHVPGRSENPIQSDLNNGGVCSAVPTGSVPSLGPMALPADSAWQALKTSLTISGATATSSRPRGCSTRVNVFYISSGSDEDGLGSTASFVAPPEPDAVQLETPCPKQNQLSFQLRSAMPLSHHNGDNVHLAEIGSIYWQPVLSCPSSEAGGCTWDAEQETSHTQATLSHLPGGV